MSGKNGRNKILNYDDQGGYISDPNPKALAASYKLLKRSTQKVWHRGEEIVKQNKVHIIDMKAKTFSVTVKGTQDYTVKLVMKRTNVDTSCTCPFRGPGICKHIVAAAIVWDREDKGASPPEETDIKYDCMPEPDNSGRNKIKQMYANPLKADLNDLRQFYKLAGEWSRPHAKLPDMPTMDINPKEPLTKQEVEKALKQIVKWSNRSRYDHYFCCGEMIAAFCEVVKVVKSRLDATDQGIRTDIVLFCQEFHNSSFLQAIDDSEGMRVFSEAYLDDLFDSILQKPDEDIVKFKRNRENYR